PLRGGMEDAEERIWYRLSHRFSSRSALFLKSAVCGVSIELIAELRTNTPPEATAPTASPGCSGVQSLRTTQIASGTLRARAISQATGIPPLKRPKITTSGRPLY